MTDLTTPTGSLAVTRHQLSTMIADPVKRYHLSLKMMVRRF
ncbi:MAG: hypothetical protein ACLSH6_08150 [Limosilactobacillus pontis]